MQVSALPVLGSYLPAGQSEQYPAPKAEYRPAEQSAQEVAADPPEYLPAEHVPPTAVNPVVGQYDPELQLLQ